MTGTVTTLNTEQTNVYAMGGTFPTEKAAYGAVIIKVRHKMKRTEKDMADDPVKKTFITFGQDHNHTIGEIEVDKDCVAVIKSHSYRRNREIAFELFGRRFCFEYPEPHADFYAERYFPRGFVEVN